MSRTSNYFSIESKKITKLEIRKAKVKQNINLKDKFKEKLNTKLEVK